MCNIQGTMRELHQLESWQILSMMTCHRKVNEDRDPETSNMEYQSCETTSDVKHHTQWD